MTKAVTSFVVGLALARLLGPKPFGEVAAAALIVGFANLFADGGFESAIVQAPELADSDIRFAFSVQVVIGMALASACAATAPIVARAFSDPVLTQIVRMLSLVFLIRSFGQVSTALLKRQLAFRRLQTTQIASYVVGYLIVGISMAYRGSGVWSLVVAQISQSAVYSLTLALLVRHPMKPLIDRRNFHLARFGAKVTAANVVNWSISSMDNVFVARSFGSTALGLYSRAFNTVATPSDAIVGTCQQVLFASCSRASDRPDALRRAYMASLSGLTLIVLPVFWSISMAAPTIALGLYGKQWAGAGPLLAPLAIAITINAAMALSGPVLNAANRVNYELKAQLFSLAVALPAFALAIHYSSVALAWVVLGVYCIRFLAATQPVLKLLDIRWKDLRLATQGSVMLAVLVALAVRATDQIARRWGVTAFPRLLLLVTTGVVAAAMLLWLAADHLLSQQLLDILCTSAPALPKRVSNWLNQIALRQKTRQTFESDLQAAVSSLKTPASLFIATVLPPRGDTGVQTHVNEFIRELTDAGIGCELVTPYSAPRVLRRAAGALRRILRMCRLSAATLYMSYKSENLLLYVSLRRRLRRDAAWTVYAQCPRSAAEAMKLRRNSRQTVVMVVHFNRSQAEEMAARGVIRKDGMIFRASQRVERRSLLAADRVVYSSRFMCVHLISRIAGLADKSHAIIPNFVRAPLPAFDGPSGDIITIGTIEPRKNQQAIIRIVAEASRRGSRYKLTIVGSGECEGQLKAIAEELGVSDLVTFTGYVPHAASLLRRHRVYAHAAIIENFGIVLIQAFAAGLPVLAPAVGGIPEIITDGVDGLFWDTSDPEKAAEQLIHILENERTWEKMSAAASATYNSRFNASTIAFDLYRFVTGSDIPYHGRAFPAGLVTQGG